MEYVSGGDLAALLKQGQMPVETILKLALDLADALTRAHKLNIVHRDLKPANVLIGSDNVLRLTDFGVARISGKARVTDTDAIVGTLDYLPPEAFRGGILDARGDILAFGVMLFEMLAGRLPFRAASVAQVVQAILTEPVPDLEAARSDAPIALVDLVYRMLARDAQARIPSVRQVGAMLEDILREGHTAAGPARFETAPPKVVSPRKHNLPTQTTTFIGRDVELAEMDRLLTDPSIRLITIVAPGGMGKTRLALEVAAKQLPRFPSGVYVVSLASLSAGEQIIPAIAEAVDLQFQPDAEPKQQLLEYLRAKQMLLVIDNFEHLLDEADLIGTILHTGPQIKIVITSREKLNLQEETLFRLEGLDVPSWTNIQSAQEYAAVKLFVQSARRSRPNFELAPEELDDLAQICQLVEGMPLALILAAAWVDTLNLRHIVQEITSSIDFLQTDLRNVPPRQRSIRAIFDYSWNLLNSLEQSVLEHLSVFRGSFTRHAAQIISGTDARTLMILVGKSLLRRDAETGQFAIHELLRQYAEEQLIASEAADAARDAHSLYYAGLLLQSSRPMTRQAALPHQSVESIGAALRARFQAAAPTPPLLAELLDPLTEREIEVLSLVAAGLSNWDIAQKLVISVSTVKTHLNRIFAKLTVKSRTQAINQAKARHLLPEG